MKIEEVRDYYAKSIRKVLYQDWRVTLATVSQECDYISMIYVVPLNSKIDGKPAITNSSPLLPSYEEARELLVKKLDDIQRLGWQVEVVEQFQIVEPSFNLLPRQVWGIKKKLGELELWVRPDRISHFIPDKSNPDRLAENRGLVLQWSVIKHDDLINETEAEEILAEAQRLAEVIAKPE